MASTIVSAEWSASVRQKTFTKWINSQYSLIEPSYEVKDLFTDLRDGVVLCSIMGNYADKDLEMHQAEDGRSLERKLMIENVDQVIHEVNCDGVRRFSRCPDLIVDGDQEATLELVWWVIFIVQLSFEDETGRVQLDEVIIQQEMLEWVQRRVELCALEVTNFSTSWSDGKAFCAVIYDYNADDFKYQDALGKEPDERLERAFQFAEEIVGVERLLDVEDVAVSVPDEKCILVYLSLLRQKLEFKPEELTLGKIGLEVWDRVIAMNAEDLPSLKSKLGEWGPPAQNEVILRQNDQLKGMKLEFDQFRSELDVLKEKMKEVHLQQLELELTELEESFDKHEKVLDNLLTASESCCAVVQRFQDCVSADDSVVHWLNEARGDVEGLLVLAKDADAHDKARDLLLKIQKAAVERKPDVDTLLHIAADFVDKRKKTVEVLDCYHEEEQTLVPTTIKEEGITLKEQASKVLQDWEWILNQCIKVLQEWFMIVLTWTFDEDFSATKERREAFLAKCNSVFDVIIRIPGTSGLQFPALRQKKKDANDHWNSLCAENSRSIDTKAEKELRELNRWVKGCLEDLASQRPLADTLEGVKVQKQWYQEFLQRVAVHEPKVLSFERLQLKGHDQPPVVLEASAIKAEHQLLGEQWEKLQQEKLAWGKLLDCCEAAWERCITTEGGLRSLEEEHAKWELPAENKDILVQLKEMETFQTSHVVPFKSEVSAMTDPMAQLESLGGHPPVDGLYQSVKERYDRLVSSLNKICRLKALFATADVLLCWTKKTRETLSEVVANKDRFGVEDHLATCKDLQQSISRKAVEFGQFQDVAVSLEVEVRGEAWNSEVVTAKNVEVQQSRVSLANFIDETQAELKTIADRLKDLLGLIADKQTWLKEFSGRLVKWRPCLGDVRIVQSELDMAEVLLAEACAHDDTIKQLRDNEDFVVEYSKPSERMPAKKAIAVICQSHADLKQALQKKVSLRRIALPLWQSFVATTTELTRWMEEKEKLLSSLSVMQSPSGSEEDGKAERIKSVQSELVEGKDKLELLNTLEADLTKVCDTEEDRSYIANRCAELRARYNDLLKKVENALALCNPRRKQRPIQHCIMRCYPCHNLKTFLMLLGLGTVMLGVGCTLARKRALQKCLGIAIPSILLAMDTTYVWALKQDVSIEL